MPWKWRRGRFILAAAIRENEMTASRYWIGIGALCVLGWLAAPAVYAQAENYPQKPVTIISDAAPGSTPDVDARFIAAGLSKAWGQQVIIINHAGANGSIAARVAAEAAPDGYTLFMPALSTFVALQSIAPNLPLKLPRDFLPIGFTAENPMFVAVTPGLGVSTLPELIALAKKQPGTISIAVTGVGRLTHLTGLLLQDRAGIQLLPVPYNGGPAAALSDVGAGRVSMIIEGYSGIVGAIKAGQVKVIAVAAAQRLPQFPDLPTVAETLPGFSATGWQVLVAPRGTPDAIINKVEVDLAKVVSDPEFQKLLSNIGSYSHAMNAREALAFVEEQQRTWLPLLEKIPVK
jgi:tripartite-type tricarboxylate transporter receptor subunit TctC